MRALVLSGGAVKGAYQIGVLKKWMGEDGTDYDIMTGVSVGALNVAGLAQAPLGQPKAAIDFMYDFWTKKVTGTSSIYKNWFPFSVAEALWKEGVYNSTPLQKLVKANFDITKLRASKRKVAVGVTSLDSGELYYSTEADDAFVDYVLGSSSYPFFLLPVEVNGQLWSDGGLRCVTPLLKAIEMGATEIDCILCDNPWLANPWTSSNKEAFPWQILRMVDLMTDQTMRYDLEVVGIRNNEVELKYPVKIRMVMPQTDLVGNSLQFNPSDITSMIAQGYKDAGSAVLYG